MSGMPIVNAKPALGYRVTPMLGFATSNPVYARTARYKIFLRWGSPSDHCHRFAKTFITQNFCIAFLRRKCEKP
jgi:hypothetical protein